MSPNGTDVTPVRTDAAIEPLPRRIPGASGHKAALGPRPAPPARPLTARPLAHDLDWDAIPTAPRGPVSMTREDVTNALRDAEQDEPAERTAYDRIVLRQAS